MARHGYIEKREIDGDRVRQAHNTEAQDATTGDLSPVRWIGYFRVNTAAQDNYTWPVDTLTNLPTR